MFKQKVDELVERYMNSIKISVEQKAGEYFAQLNKTPVATDDPNVIIINAKAAGSYIVPDHVIPTILSQAVDDTLGSVQFTIDCNEDQELMIEVGAQVYSKLYENIDIDKMRLVLRDIYVDKQYD
jgi:hypothetical protein